MALRGRGRTVRAGSSVSGLGRPSRIRTDPQGNTRKGLGEQRKGERHHPAHPAGVPGPGWVTPGGSPRPSPGPSGHGSPYSLLSCCRLPSGEHQASDKPLPCRADVPVPCSGDGAAGRVSANSEHKRRTDGQGDERTSGQWPVPADGPRARTGPLNGSADASSTLLAWGDLGRPGARVWSFVFLIFLGAAVGNAQSLSGA